MISLSEWSNHQSDVELYQRSSLRGHHKRVKLQNDKLMIALVSGTRTIAQYMAAASKGSSLLFDATSASKCWGVGQK